MQEPRQPTRDYLSEIVDSTRWRQFRPRIGDIVVNTPPKAGTTWTQAILALLISGDPLADAKIGKNCPWVDISVYDLNKVIETLESQTHRRHVKSHTAFDGIPVWPDLRYITVYRHPIDIFFSMRKHIKNMVREAISGITTPDLHEGFEFFVSNENLGNTSIASIVNHYKNTLALEPAENQLRLHYADMTRDLTGTFDSVSQHINISHPDALMKQLVEAADFKNMQKNARRFAPGAGMGIWKSDAGFFDSATSNKWEDVLTDEELQTYGERMDDLLTQKERHWLEWGTTT